MKQKNQGKISKRSELFVLATPIGNLEDFSLRGIRILKEADLVICEDTRVTRKLLSHFNITNKVLLSYTDEEEQEKSRFICNRIESELLTAVLVSDAGSPCISDPGYRLVKLARAMNITVTALPGPSSPIALLSISGLPTDRFVFVGFLPQKLNQIKGEFEHWRLHYSDSSIVYLDSNRRCLRNLRLLAEHFPEASVAFGRELTKIHEECILAPVRDLLIELEGRDEIRGECVIGVSLNLQVQKSDVEELTKKIERYAMEGFKRGESLKNMLLEFKESGLHRKQLYELLLNVKDKLSR